MTPQQKKLFLSKRGQIVKVTYHKPLKTLKQYSYHSIERVTKRTARVGIDYSNTASAKLKRQVEAIERAHPLPWGEWKLFPFVISHRGSNYLRFYKAPNEWKMVGYLLDGKSVSAMDIVHMLYKGELDEGDQEVFNIKEENIIDIR